MTVRYSKMAMVLCLGIFASLVAFTNLTDLAGNRPFVQHVLSMDTTFRAPSAAYRAVTNPLMWAIAYGLIILGEALSGMLMLAAAIRMFLARNRAADDFGRARMVFHFGALAGFLVWFLGFMTIGGEWFLMWQSTVWNGQESAFRFYTTILLVLVYVNQPDGDLRLIRVDPAPADEVSLLGCKVDR